MMTAKQQIPGFNQRKASCNIFRSFFDNKLLSELLFSLITFDLMVEIMF